MKVLSRLWANHPQGSEWGATSGAPHSTSAPYRNVTYQLSSRSLGDIGAYLSSERDLTWLLVELPHRLAKRSGVGLLEGGGPHLPVDPI